jgi:hypothetical protein
MQSVSVGGTARLPKCWLLSYPNVDFDSGLNVCTIRSTTVLVVATRIEHLASGTILSCFVPECYTLFLTISLLLVLEHTSSLSTHSSSNYVREDDRKLWQPRWHPVHWAWAAQGLYEEHIFDSIQNTRGLSTKQWKTAERSGSKQESVEKIHIWWTVRGKQLQLLTHFQVHRSLNLV